MPTPSARILVAAVCLIVMTFSFRAMASKPDNVTDAELALLPKYCPDTMGFHYGDASWNTSPNAGRWVAIMGPGFWHVHHYCWALIKLRRADRAGVPDQQREGHRQSALTDLVYVMNNVKGDFVLAPEILTWIGRTELSLRRPNQAEEAFAKAREIKPDYWPAYSHWAEYLKSAGRRSDALEIVKAGLQQAPSARTLQEIYLSLGGKAGDFKLLRQARPAPPADAAAAPPAPQLGH
jgi:tetratricopeptide (TPR) repeat protein